jgi:hypothetical protein
MDPLKYLLPEPPLELTPQTIAGCESQFAALRASAARRVPRNTAGQGNEYRLPYPKWQFLACIAENHPVVFHGTPLRDLAVVEPRQSNDINEFGAQNAIYATDDAIWAMFFAILDRPRIQMSISNAAVRLQLASGELARPLYFFSINQEALDLQPFCEGAIYVLPKEPFVRDPIQKVKDYDIVVPHWASRQPAVPLVRLMVTPQDFPFLAQIRGHNQQVLLERARADPNGFPWIDETES